MAFIAAVGVVALASPSRNSLSATSATGVKFRCVWQSFCTDGKCVKWTDSHLQNANDLRMAGQVCATSILDCVEQRHHLVSLGLLRMIHKCGVVPATRGHVSHSLPSGASTLAISSKHTSLEFRGCSSLDGMCLDAKQLKR
jgi:hypothetical protein